MTDTAPKPLASAILAARDGRETDAADILADLLRQKGHNDTPIGFLVSVLRQGGSTELANWLVDRAVSHGYDVTAMQPRFDDVLANTDATAACGICRRYERTFAAGTANALMIGRYAIALSRAGEWDKLAALYPSGRTILQIQLDAVDGFDSLAAFNDTVVQDIREAAQQEVFDGRNYMQGAVRYHNVHKIDRPAVARLIEIAGQGFDDFAATNAQSDADPLAVMRPATRRIVAWANMYDAGSFVEPHLHHEGWLIAVYYPRLPEVPAGPEHAGALKVACPVHLGGIAAPPSIAAWPEVTIDPQPGLLVIMPSYCFHHSVPFAATGERVAVTIDQSIDLRARKVPFVPLPHCETRR